MSHRRRFLTDCFLTEPLRFVPVSHNPCVWHDRGQHMYVFQPVNVVFLWTAHIDLLAPGIIGMRADAVNCDNTRIKLLAPVDQDF